MKGIINLILCSVLLTSQIPLSNSYTGLNADTLSSENLAYRKDVNVSGTEIEGRFGGKLAVDGIVSNVSRWSGAKQDEQFLEVDLGAVMEISEVMLNFSSESPEYEVQISQDGVNYKTIYTETEGSQGDTVIKQVSFEKQPARFVKYVQHKMFLNPNGKKYSSSLYEIEIYEEFNIEKIEIVDFSGYVTKGKTHQLETKIAPDNAAHKKLNYVSSNANIVTVDDKGLLTGINEGKAVITVSSSSDATIKTEIEVEITGPIKVTELYFDEKEISLSLQDKRFLEYNVKPLNATEIYFDVVWTSSDPSVVTVNKDGMIEGHKIGSADIEVVNADNVDVRGTIKINIVDSINDVDYTVMKNRWLERIVGKNINMSDPDIAAYVKKIDNEGQQLWSDLHKEENRTTLWDKIPSDTVSADYTTQFTKLQKLCLAFGIEGSSLYQNKGLCQDIIEAIEFMVVTKKYNGSYRTGNWWDWEIGSTHQLCDILMIMSGYTDYSKIEKAIKSIEGYVPKPSRNGANLTDLSFAVLGSAIVAKNDQRMEMVKDRVPETMVWVTSGDGIYKDGLVIQHGKHAYNGSYGNELIKGIGKIQNIIAGTKFEITDKNIQNVYDVIVNGYLPLMHQGQMMSMVNGRSISRAPGTNNPFTTEFATGAETISNILLLIDSAPENKKVEIEAALKSWLTDSIGNYDFYTNARDFASLIGAKKIMENENIESQKFTGMKVYGSMDRIVQANNNYTAGLSMYSSRVYNYECINNENLKGWHTGDGALYIYNNDLKQYGEGYWPTVDSYRLPGTTTDTRSLSNGAANGKSSPQALVGGVTDGVNGTAAMLYNSTNLGLGMDLKARKSWFFLNGKIVAVGSDINGTTDASIETTVENRMLTDVNNKITINGKDFDKESEKLKLEDGSFVHLTGTGKDNDLGYYFIQGGDVDIAKEKRTGEYKDINTMFPNGIKYEKNYFKMGINHGQNAKDESYGYIILPGISSNNLETYASNQSVKIIRNDDQVQAITDEDSDTFAINVWAETPVTVNGVTINNSSSLFMTEKNGLITINVSDPKQKNVTLELKLEDGYDSVVSVDDSVTVNKDGTFTIDTTNSAGSAHTIVLAKAAVNKQMLEIAVEEASKVTEQELDKLVPIVAEKFKEALAKAKEVLANKGATQVEVNVAADRLSLIMHYLEFTKGDKESLQALVNRIDKLDKEIYQENLWLTMELILAEAKKLLADENALQVDVEKIYEDLVISYLNLRLKPNKDLLKELIDQTSNLNSAHYTGATWKVFNQAYMGAKAIYENPEATEAMIVEAISKLEAAYQALTKVDQRINNPVKPKVEQAVKTGDNVNIAGVIMALLVTGMGIELLKKRKMIK